MTAAAATPAETFTGILAGLRHAVAAAAAKNPVARLLLVLIWSRLGRLARRFTALAARVEAGTAAPRRRASPRPAAARPRPAYRRLPRRFAWLPPLVPGAATAGSQLQYLAGGGGDGGDPRRRAAGGADAAPALPDAGGAPAARARPAAAPRPAAGSGLPPRRRPVPGRAAIRPAARRRRTRPIHLAHRAAARSGPLAAPASACPAIVAAGSDSIRVSATRSPRPRRPPIRCRARPAAARTRPRSASGR